MEIVFTGAPPSQFASDSCIKIRVEDISLADAPSKLLGQSTIPLKQLNAIKPLKFKVFSNYSSPNATSVAVAATLHLGHCSRSIKIGDYITDKNHLLNISGDLSVVHNIKIPLKQYRK